MIIPNIWKNNPNVPNHQPDIDPNMGMFNQKTLGFYQQAGI
jgi:hypothetical protein